MPTSELRSQVLGLVLAAGEGRRYGQPKVLVDDWLVSRVDALVGGGCAPVIVTLGAAADCAARLVPPDVGVVVVADWGEGMGASLRAGIQAARATVAQAILVTLVDTPGLTADAVARVRSAAGEGAAVREALVQATYSGVRGHPVLLGREHWDGVAEIARGDRGARDYLDRNGPIDEVECGDVAHGRDVDER